MCRQSPVLPTEARLFILITLAVPVALASLGIWSATPAAAQPYTIPADGDAWTEFDTAVAAAEAGWYIEQESYQQLIVSETSQVGEGSVGCRALADLWCDDFGLAGSADLYGFQRLVFWQRATWTGRVFHVALTMVCTPAEIEAGYDLKRVSWIMPTTADWSLFAADLADGTWAWRRAGWDWQYGGGNTEVTTATGIIWEFCQYFGIAVGDELLIDGLRLEGEIPTAAPVAIGAPMLAPAVPNPFNPRTEIAFTLPAPARVRLQIHAVDGRRVRTLVAGDRPAGRQVVVWAGRDDAGRPLPSGTYRCLFEVDGQRSMRGVTLLK